MVTVEMNGNRVLVSAASALRGRSRLLAGGLAAVLAGLAALGIPSPGVAQQVGVTAGVNRTTITGEDVDDADSRTGFLLGAFVRLPLAPLLSLQPEVVYTQKGASGPFADDGSEVDLESSYVEVPVLLRLGTPLGLAGLHAFGGPTFAFEAGCDITVDAPGVEGTVDCDDDLFGGRLDRKSFDVGFQVGGGIDFSVLLLPASLDVRFTRGLSTFIDDGETDAQNQVLSLTLQVATPGLM